jgi:AmmeMemoRadiSam system protein A
MINEADRRSLLRLARETIAARVLAQPEPTPQSCEAFSVHAGVFVSIHSCGDLRGCIGHIEPNETLGALIPRCAIAAATTDPRFPAVSAQELPDLDIELSILGPLEPAHNPDDFEIGRHGLVVEMGMHRGLLLPQVATQWKWNGETFLAQTCRKAGLPAEAWKHGATVWRFEAEVFGEGSLHPKGC